MHLKEEINEKAKQISDELILLRRDIHQYPEPAFEENRTASLVKEYLNACGIEANEIAKTGVKGILRGIKPGKTILLRADMDCLQISEETGQPYESKRDGFMHACGHDAHTAWLLGAAKILSFYKDRMSGNVVFAFQPAEESSEGGAIDMVRDGVLENPTVDIVIGAHVEVSPKFQTGTIGIKYGPMNAAADFFSIKVIGKSGHGALPHSCIDPISVAVQIYTAFQFAMTKQIDPLAPALLHVGSFHGGTINNAVPESVMIKGTIRTFDGATREQVIDIVRSVVASICSLNHAEYDLEITPVCPPLINDHDATQYIQEQANAFYGEANVIVMENPDLFAEDHAYYQQDRPGTVA